ncbi:hypothetical protein ECP02999173_0919, partial [Escherichia coli P0299917.3]
MLSLYEKIKIRLIILFLLAALAGKRLFYRAVFLFVVRSGQQPEIYDGCNGAQPGDY